MQCQLPRKSATAVDRAWSPDNLAVDPCCGMCARLHQAHGAQWNAGLHAGRFSASIRKCGCVRIGRGTKRCESGPCGFAPWLQLKPESCANFSGSCRDREHPVAVRDWRSSWS